MGGMVILLLTLFVVPSLILGIIVLLRKFNSGIKVMLLGIHVTLLGGIIAIDPNFSLYGFEYLIAFLGLVVSFIGFSKNN